MNYYLEEKKCECCGYTPEPLHIGKNSGGWCFALHVHYGLKIKTLDDWKAYARKEISCGASIKDECGNTVSEEEMWDMVENRSYDGPYRKGVLDDPYTMQGPNGLLRSPIDKEHCIGHGEGTWDYIASDFA